VNVCITFAKKTHAQTSRIVFIFYVNLAVGRSSSDDNAISYVLPVLWMTSCFHIMGPRGQNIIRHYVSSSSLGSRTGGRRSSSVRLQACLSVKVNSRSIKYMMTVPLVRLRLTFYSSPEIHTVTSRLNCLVNVVCHRSTRLYISTPVHIRGVYGIRRSRWSTPGKFLRRSVPLVSPWLPRWLSSARWRHQPTWRRSPPVTCAQYSAPGNK